MLKIGTVKWRGKCSKHPGYDPSDGGLGAIKGNCARCLELEEIFECHQKTMRLMRKFQPIVEKKSKLAPLTEFQESLF